MKEEAKKKTCIWLLAGARASGQDEKRISCKCLGDECEYWGNPYLKGGKGSGFGNYVFNGCRIGVK